MKEKNLTNAEVARLTGLHTTTVSRLKRNTNDPDWKTLKLMARTLPIKTWEELLGPVKNGKQDTSVANQPPA